MRMREREKKERKEEEEEVKRKWQLALVTVWGDTRTWRSYHFSVQVEMTATKILNWRPSLAFIVKELWGSLWAVFEQTFSCNLAVQPYLHWSEQTFVVAATLYMYFLNRRLFYACTLYFKREVKIYRARNANCTTKFVQFITGWPPSRLLPKNSAAE